MSGIKRTPADVKFSRMIRERDNWTCQRCGKEHSPSSRGLHSAHMFTRRTRSARLDPDNACALCYGCHQHLDSHPEEKTGFWVGRIGIERFDSLSARAHGKRDR
jgi:late competence protein required for DNA uptake (superfamily II DNA/RNA helicase)